MKSRPVESWRTLLPLLVLLAFPHGLAARQTKAAPATAGASSTAIDSLTAPIALYPDALVGQILKASTDFPALKTFAGWLAGNTNLKGSALQDAAQAAGFAVCYVALAPFPQVVQMMVEKADWTQQLGKAFTTNRSAVLDSIQRLRATAQELGDLTTTEQQEVVTETTASGQQVIVIQPANPEVIYVPVYNTQTVYVQQAPPPSSGAATGAGLLGFTAGVLIGAAVNNDHYYGRWGAYDEAWDRREDYYEDRQDYAEDRRENAQETQSQRQSQRQDTQSQRQSQRQSTSQERQSNRQTAAGTSSAATGRETARRSEGSGGLSGYQSGSKARRESSRGSASRSGGQSRGGGGGRRR